MSRTSVQIRRDLQRPRPCKWCDQQILVTRANYRTGGDGGALLTMPKHNSVSLDAEPADDGEFAIVMLPTSAFLAFDPEGTLAPNDQTTRYRGHDCPARNRRNDG